MLSIIMPVYNGEKYIAETVSHIQDSAYQDFEIIAVNDGSLDSSESILSKLSEMDKRIRYYFKENGGIVSARNFGLDKAVGKFICFVDQDDIVLPDMFELLISAMEETEADFVQGGASALIEGKELLYYTDTDRSIFEKGTKAYRQELAGLVFRGGTDYRNHINASLWNKIFRRDFIVHNRIRFHRFCDYEDDWIFSMECLQKSSRVVAVEKTIYLWRVHMGSESHNRVKKDQYIEAFYEKHCRLRAYLMEVLRETELSAEDFRRFENEQRKQSLLWGLSNETGRGITGRSSHESCQVMKEMLRKERRKGRISLGMLLRPLPVTIYGHTGIRKAFYIFRDILLSCLLVLHMEWLAVILNKHVLHGRWHI